MNLGLCWVKITHGHKTERGVALRPLAEKSANKSSELLHAYDEADCVCNAFYSSP